MENNIKQHEQPKQLGGITGRGFLPGHSGNPRDRPRTRGLVTALRLKMAEIGPDGRSIEERLVAALVEEGLRGKHRLAAIEAILDRLEGKPKQQLDVNDISDDIRRRPTEDLRFYMESGHWPEDAPVDTDVNSQPESENIAVFIDTSKP